MSISSEECLKDDNLLLKLIIYVHAYLEWLFIISSNILFMIFEYFANSCFVSCSFSPLRAILSLSENLVHSD